LPCYFYIDECQNVIRRDEKISTILDECRSQKIAMIMAHQRSAQITSPNVLDALANCAIRMANSDDEAKYLADKLRTSTDFMRSLPRGTFATFVRDLTPRALALKIPYTDLSTLPRMSAAEQQAIREQMRTQFSFTPQKPHAASPQASPAPPPAFAAAKITKAAPASPPKTTSEPAATAKPYTKQQTGAPTDPHAGDHAEPASKWGE
jgi:TraM recognition site of TraD and TraG